MQIVGKEKVTVVGDTHGQLAGVWFECSLLPPYFSLVISQPGHKKWLPPNFIILFGVFLKQVLVDILSLGICEPLFDPQNSFSLLTVLAHSFFPLCFLILCV